MTNEDPIRPTHKKQVASKNLVLLAVLLAIVALLFAITIMRLGQTPYAAAPLKVSGQ